MQTDKASILDPFAGNFPHTTKLQMFNYSGTTMTKQLRFRSAILIYFCFFVKELHTCHSRSLSCSCIQQRTHLCSLFPEMSGEEQFR